MSSSSTWLWPRCVDVAVDEATGAETWGGRQVARRASDAQPRRRVLLAGVITRVRVRSIGGTASLCCSLDDGTGSVDLLFLSRSSIPGVDVGVRCRVEGTAQDVAGTLEVWNPVFEIEATGDERR